MTVLNRPGTARSSTTSAAPLRLRPEADAAGHHLVLDLLPFGVAAVRVGAVEVKIASVVPYPSDAVLDQPRNARYDEVSSQLLRLGRKADADHAGPPDRRHHRPHLARPAPDRRASRTVAMSFGSNPNPTRARRPPPRRPAARGLAGRGWAWGAW